jgi:hypothetical protein
MMPYQIMYGEKRDVPDIKHSAAELGYISSSSAERKESTR